jgi:type II secretory pathway pseudopilin PulG
MGTVKKEEHSPALAAILSFIIAGLGQMYNGQVWKGFIIFVTSLLVIPWIIGIFDAYFVAKRISRGEIALKKKTGCLIAMIIWVFVSWVMVFILAIFAAIAIPSFMKTRIIASEKATVVALRSISSALESYAEQNNNVYPQSEESLLNLKPAYLPFAYNNRKIYGYLFKEELWPSGYRIIASPVDCNVTGTKIYTIETGGKLSEGRCGRLSPANYESD